ncbi:hypothetical protein ADUPG1_010775 [Aduncisulcus paluster]|uniref:Uncharacterized protein n=1 Tax=Aduncisulcus paluster TaxID=2918883 RepID=A0ABQ5JXA2_9EUKA|nr:hypothetical protein ADUPG1_010775 [Aduncisulcus paluster]
MCVKSLGDEKKMFSRSHTKAPQMLSSISLFASYSLILKPIVLKDGISEGLCVHVRGKMGLSQGECLGIPIVQCNTNHFKHYSDDLDSQSNWYVPVKIKEILISVPNGYKRVSKVPCGSICIVTLEDENNSFSHLKAIFGLQGVCDGVRNYSPLLMINERLLCALTHERRIRNLLHVIQKFTQSLTSPIQTILSMCKMAFYPSLRVLSLVKSQFDTSSQSGSKNRYSQCAMALLSHLSMSLWFCVYLANDGIRGGGCIPKLDWNTFSPGNMNLFSAHVLNNSPLYFCIHGEQAAESILCILRGGLSVLVSERIKPFMQEEDVSIFGFGKRRRILSEEEEEGEERGGDGKLESVEEDKRSLLKVPKILSCFSLPKIELPSLMSHPLSVQTSYPSTALLESVRVPGDIVWIKEDLADRKIIVDENDIFSASSSSLPPPHLGFFCRPLTDIEADLSSLGVFQSLLKFNVKTRQEEEEKVERKRNNYCEKWKVSKPSYLFDDSASSDRGKSDSDANSDLNSPSSMHNDCLPSLDICDDLCSRSHMPPLSKGYDGSDIQKEDEEELERRGSQRVFPSFDSRLVRTRVCGVWSSQDDAWRRQRALLRFFYSREYLGDLRISRKHRIPECIYHSSIQYPSLLTSVLNSVQNTPPQTVLLIDMTEKGLPTLELSYIRASVEHFVKEGVLLCGGLRGVVICVVEKKGGEEEHHRDSVWNDRLSSELSQRSISVQSRVPSYLLSPSLPLFSFSSLSSALSSSIMHSFPTLMMPLSMGMITTDSWTIKGQCINIRQRGGFYGMAVRELFRQLDEERIGVSWSRLEEKQTHRLQNRFQKDARDHQPKIYPYSLISAPPFATMPLILDSSHFSIPHTSLVNIPFIVPSISLVGFTSSVKIGTEGRGWLSHRCCGWVKIAGEIGDTSKDVCEFGLVNGGQGLQNSSLDLHVIFSPAQESSSLKSMLRELFLKERRRRGVGWWIAGMGISGIERKEGDDEDCIDGDIQVERVFREL